MAIQCSRHPERLTDATGTRAKILRSTSPVGHDIQAIHGVHRPDEDRTGIALLSGHHIEAPVDPVAEVHVGDPGRTEHGSVAARPTVPGGGVGGRVRWAKVRFDLDNDAFGPSSVHRGQQPRTEKIGSHLLGRTGEEPGSQRLARRPVHPTARRLQAYRPVRHGIVWSAVLVVGARRRSPRTSASPPRSAATSRNGL